MERIEDGPAEKLMIAVFGEHRSYYPYIVTEKDDRQTRVELMIAIQNALMTLLPQEKRGLELRFGLSDSDDKLRTFREVGRELSGVTSERARQIVSRALRKLRQPIRSNLLRKFIIPSPEEICSLRTEVARLRSTSISLDEQNQRLKEILKACGITEQVLEGVRSEDLASAKKDRDALQALIAEFPNNRVWNPIRRAGIFRLSKLENLVRGGKIRSLDWIGAKGEKFLKEILQK